MNIYVSRSASGLTVSLVGAAVLAVLSATPSNALDAKPVYRISGLAYVRDGDTITVRGTAVRLKGVDAAERGTPRGEEARIYMIGVLADNPIIECDLTGERTYDRAVGYCRPAGATALEDELGARIIGVGLALSCPRFSARYDAFEAPVALAAQPRAPYCNSR